MIFDENRGNEYIVKGRLGLPLIGLGSWEMFTYFVTKLVLDHMCPGFKAGIHNSGQTIFTQPESARAGVAEQAVPASSQAASSSSQQAAESAAQPRSETADSASENESAGGALARGRPPRRRRALAPLARSIVAKSLRVVHAQDVRVPASKNETKLLCGRSRSDAYAQPAIQALIKGCPHFKQCWGHSSISDWTE